LWWRLFLWKEAKMAATRVRPEFDDDMDPAAAAAMASFRARLLGIPDTEISDLSPREQGYVLEIRRLREELKRTQDRVKFLENQTLTAIQVPPEEEESA
jgi:hypothetical protein